MSQLKSISRNTDISLAAATCYLHLLHLHVYVWVREYFFWHLTQSTHVIVQWKVNHKKKLLKFTSTTNHRDHHFNQGKFTFILQNSVTRKLRQCMFVRHTIATTNWHADFIDWIKLWINNMAGSSLRRLMAEYKRKYWSVLKKISTFCSFLVFSFASDDLMAFQFFFFHLPTLRIWCDCTELTLNPPEGIVAGPISEDNFFEWEALIQ